MIFDPIYLIMMLPGFALALWAQSRVKSAFQAASQVPARLSGAVAARHILDSAGLQDVGIEQTPGHLSDHYDPIHNVLRLSEPVYHGRTQAAVGIAAHEAGHAIQKARHYLPLVVRNMAVPVASFGSNGAFFILFGGVIMSTVFESVQLGGTLINLGILLFGAVLVFQVINLPVEFDASKRAKAELVSLGIVPAQEMVHVNKVLNAAALTYVAATLQAAMTFLYFFLRYGGSRD